MFICLPHAALDCPSTCACGKVQAGQAGTSVVHAAAHGSGVSDPAVFLTALCGFFDI